MSWMPRITDLSIGKSTMSRAVITALTPGSRSAFEVSIDADAGVRMRAAQHLAPDHAGHGGVGGEGRAARDLVGAVGANGALADPLVVGDDVHCDARFLAPAFQRRSPEPRGRSCRNRCSGRDCRRARTAPLPRSASDSCAAARRRRPACPRCRCRIAAPPLPGISAAADAGARRCAMPSMVRISRPSASTASIRQEQTRRSSSVMLQAPQSPDAQPSLEPVSAERSAQRVEHGVARPRREIPSARR